MWTGPLVLLTFFHTNPPVPFTTCGKQRFSSRVRPEEKVIGTTAFTLNSKIPPVGGLLINLIYPYSRLADLKCAQNKSWAGQIGNDTLKAQAHLLVHNEHPKQEVDSKSTTLPENRIINELNTQSSYIHGRHAIKLDWNGRTSAKNKPAIGRTKVIMVDLHARWTKVGELIPKVQAVAWPRRTLWVRTGQ